MQDTTIPMNKAHEFLSLSPGSSEDQSIGRSWVRWFDNQRCPYRVLYGEDGSILRVYKHLIFGDLVCCENGERVFLMRKCPYDDHFQPSFSDLAPEERISIRRGATCLGEISRNSEGALLLPDDQLTPSTQDTPVLLYKIESQYMQGWTKGSAFLGGHWYFWRREYDI